MSYIESSKIKMFPVVGRGSDFEESYLTTEDNLTKSLSYIKDQNNTSWVVSSTNEAPFKFVIKGYTFELDEALSGTKYATIYIKKSLEAGNYQRLVNKDGSLALDANGSFTGLEISTTIPEKLKGDIESFTLQLLDEGNIPDSSKLSYYASEIFDEETGAYIKDSFKVNNLIVDESLITKDLTATTATITTLTSNKITADTGNITNISSTEINTTNLTSNVIEAQTSTITTETVKNLTVTNSLIPPTNFYGKYTITFDGTTLDIKENY